MKRIVHIVGYAIRGGCETNCAVFIRHTPEMDHHVIVLDRAGPMSEVWKDLGATVSHHFSLEQGWLGFYRRVRALVRILPMDGAIVWGGIRVPLVLAGLAGLDCPTVIHAGNPFAAGRRVRLMLMASGWFFARPRSVTVVACSEHVARTYRKAPYFRLFPIEVCLNPVEILAVNPHSVRALGPAESARIGMVARLDPIKDHATLIQAFARLHQRWPRAELQLAGDGALRAPLEALAQKLGIGDAVRFHGTIADVPAFLNRLDLFCYITTEQEGMGNALAEALAHGLPCVVNDLPVLREVAGIEGRAARFTQSTPSLVDREIEDLLGDAGERRRLSEAAWRRAGEIFAPERAVRSYLSALKILA
jgi:glycosyltransferase involved in cell wall biosynthesis